MFFLVHINRPSRSMQLWQTQNIASFHFLEALLLASQIPYRETYMAKEVDLKRIELKVSVNCCDGCKRKVKKALRNVEGVLKTEIDPSHPKLTVIGNMDPQILIKKLTKVGKQTEILSMQGIHGKENQEMGKEATKERENQIPECEQVKYPDSSDTKAVKTRESTDGDHKYNEDNKKASKNEQNDSNINSKSKKKKKKEKAKTVTDNNEVIKNEVHLPPPPPLILQDQVNFNMYPSMVHEMGRTHSQYCYKVEPYAAPMPCYAIPSYSYHVASPPPPFPPMSYGYQDYYNYERPVYHPTYQAPVMRAGDYFSDENTIGCHIM